ncbi:MAG: class I SAM-dependent methyltransferase, partial [Candidatus Marinimicrobia bacterium]|nr:class I SAM-dependent methyltransferase [Candidatus Neomarinimicrobiota bacterium]
MTIKNRKKEFPTIKKQGINYLIDEDGKIKKFQAWFEDMSSIAYDKVMEKGVFPKLFNGDIHKHFDILKKEFEHIHNLNIIEIATGSGTLAKFLPNDNEYTGIDISNNLLQKAKLRFKEQGFRKFELYNASAEQLPFEENTFDFAVCNLALNFLDDIDLSIQELRRVLKINS